MKTRFVALIVALCLTIAGRSQAVITNWTVQSASSSLTLAASLSSGGTFLASLSEQGPGSLTTTYGGTVATSQSLSGGNPTDIAVLSANLLANNSGNWDPLDNGNAGTAPANYGPRLDLGFLGGAWFAYRDLAADLSGAAAPLSGVPFATQSFTSSLDFEFIAGTVATRSTFGGILGYEIGAEPTPIETVIGEGGTFLANGTISYGPGGDAGIATLTIPVNLLVVNIAAGSDTTTTTDDIGLYYSFTGQIVATAPTASVPEASSLALLGLAGSIVGFVGYRRTRKTNH